MFSAILAATRSAECVTKSREMGLCPGGAPVGDGETMSLGKLLPWPIQSETLTQGSDGIGRNYSQTVLSSVNPCEGAVHAQEAWRPTVLLDKRDGGRCRSIQGDVAEVATERGR